MRVAIWFKFEPFLPEKCLGEGFSFELFAPGVFYSHSGSVAASSLLCAAGQGRLAVTAAEYHRGGQPIPGVPSAGNSDERRIGFTCRSAANGRRAIRALGEWSGRFELSEPEFQILWCLKSASGCDQTTIARQLACSPAQVSATVERMRAEGLIKQQSAPSDRRRNLWQLSDRGQKLLIDMLRAADQLRYPADDDKCASTANVLKEAA